MGSLRRKLIYLLEETVALGAEVERPALLVEVGFPGSAEGWRRPGETQGDPDLDEQARLFEALMRALHALDVAGALDASPGQGRLAGLFLWCWSTDPDAGRVEDESHTPQNRPALQQVKRLFRIE